MGKLLDVCQSNWLNSFDLKDIAVLNYQRDFSKERREGDSGQGWAARTEAVTRQPLLVLCQELSDHTAQVPLSFLSLLTSLKS